MQKLRESPATMLAKEEITTIEMEYLERVFKYLISHDKNKPKKHEASVSWMDIATVLLKLGLNPSRSECKLIVWEVDDDLDEHINWNEFKNMYKRCIMKNSELEPRKLYNLVMFLMYDSKEFKGSVTVEETLQILFVRNGRDQLDLEIQAIFGEDQKNIDGVEKSINYKDFLDKIQQRNRNDFLAWEEMMCKKKIPLG